MSEDTRSELLTLVRQQIDTNLSQIADAAQKHAATPNNAALTPCVMLAHQAAGALRMVQLPGAARFGSEIETALKTALHGAPADVSEVGMAGRAATALREFINDVAGGGNYVPLRLYPVFRDLARVGGNAAASEKDLFFPEIHDNAPAHATPRAITPAVLPALVKDLRSRFQRGLLAWLKESAKTDGPAQMRAVLDQLHQIASQLPEPRGLWWASTVLMDSVIELLPDPRAAEWIARVKPVCSRIDFLLRDLAAGARADAAPAQRDVYYAIASCRLATPRISDAQRLLQLEKLIPEAQAAQNDIAGQQPLIDDARARLENIKAVWTEYAAGEPNRLTRFRDLLAPLSQKARELGNLPLLQLLLAIQNSTTQLPDPYPLDGQLMSLEMASALLMAESIFTHYSNLPADLEQQVAIMKGWLADAVAGKIASSSPAGLRADIVQKASDEKLRIATAREIIKNLQQVEKGIETYANDASNRAALAPLAAILRQVQGVFEMSNQKRAARLARACKYLIERCASGSAADHSRDIEWLAEGLGCLGFYLDPCLHGKEPAERAINLYFTRYEKQEGLEALLSLSQQMVAVKPASAETASPTAPAVPAAPAVDREMLEVFLEEASEVLTAMEASIGQARKGEGSGSDGDALLNVRRGFHTLKGSSRMVGLSAYGDCAWEMEQVMNHWLAQTMPATPQLLDLSSDARALLAEWAHALQGEAEPAVNASGIATRARALRGVAPPVVKAPAPIPPAKPAAPPSAMPVQTLPNVLDAAKTPAAAPVAAPTPNPLQNMETVVISTTRPMRTDASPFEEPAGAPVVVDITSTAPPARDTLIATATTSQVTAAPVGPYEQTFAKLDDRLSRIGGLVQEVQQQTQNVANLRLAQIADALGDNMNEVRDLHRKLRELLTAHQQ